MSLEDQFGEHIKKGATLLVRDGIHIVRTGALQIELAKAQGYSEAALPIKSLDSSESTTAKPLTERQQEQYEDFEARAGGEGDPLTERQQGILDDLRAKREAYLESIA